MTENELRQWAQSFIGKEMSKPFSREKSTVVSFTVGKKLTGVWFKLESGHVVYRNKATGRSVKCP